MNTTSIISSAAFDLIVERFVSSHGEKRRPKILITQEMYDEAIAILKNPEDKTISTPKHRYWKTP
ncbi:4555_t:CDS:2 [Paraglomus occultum]|uniref:4555_t:CDS:1 n=1 Tax=Paraglomus occultum TaxID=144539 RepID=A0A9N9CN12_9GLOM|nr:4555_t:CDS:2 [Paraglomus occultum]